MRTKRFISGSLSWYRYYAAHGRKGPRRSRLAGVLQPGDRIPADATVWIRPREPVTLGELVEDGPVLLLFYLFDWSDT
jgi:hypothetical protein